VTDARLRSISAILALVGAGIAAYLLHVRSTGGTLLCATGGCETVQGSRYSELAGVPVAALGLAGFATLFALALLPGEAARLANAVVALGALGFSAYLLVVQVAVIGAICQWCVATDVVATALAAVALIRLLPAFSPRGTPRAVPPPPRAGAVRRA
jgi:uncharacterized membrane protein